MQQGTVVGDAAGGCCAGGLIGSGNATGCFATGNVDGDGGEDDCSVGGLIGSGDAMNCFATGTVVGYTYYKFECLAGGLIGDGNATNCFATGNVSSSNVAGGLIGDSSSSITNCYATGKVTAKSAKSATYAAGLSPNTPTIKNSYYNTTANPELKATSDGDVTGSFGVDESYMKSKPFVKALNDGVDVEAGMLSWMLAKDKNGGYPVCSVEVNVNGKTKKVYQGGTYKPATPKKKTGCTFNGWYTDATFKTRFTSSTKVTSSITLFPQYKANKYTITLDANGGKVGKKETKTVKRTHGKTLGELTQPTRENYKFTGWYTKRNGGTKIKTTAKVKKNVTYYSHWKIVK